MKKPMTDRLKKYILLLFFVGLLPQLGLGQIDDDYFTADRLLQQQEYEEAAEKFYELHQEHPDTYIFLDKLIEALINLKKYDEAISITQQAYDYNPSQPQSLISLGEIYHVSGDTEKAFEVWNEVLDNHSHSQQVHLNVARAMKERRAYDQAAEVYKEAREISPSSNIITPELADAYLQAGNYEKAIQEYLELVNNNPDRLNFVQRRLMRFQDDNIYDVAILEISDFLNELSMSHPSHHNLQQLEIWLLMERKLFKRALVTAKNFETRSSEITYSLYNLGSQLLAEQEFGLAEEAYSFYIDSGVASLKNRSKEELAKVYIKWAEYLEDYNLHLSSKRNELYHKALSTLESLHQENPYYRRMDQVLIMLSEISLDVLHEPQKASAYLDELNKSDDPVQIAQKAYIEGRLHLYKEDYTRARMTFSKSNKQERIGDLAEKTRYYMALCDFYAGDYEFAKIQLNALERQNTSYYANNAVRIRLWIQEGLQADSTGAALQPFAKAVEHFSRGEDQLGINILHTLFEEDRYNPLIDEALLELSAHKNSKNALFVYRAVSTFLKQQGQASPLYERLLWERARLGDQFVTNEEIDMALSQEEISDSLDTTEEQLFKDSTNAIPTNVEEVVPLYEEILLNFPNGFYSSYARERIQELQQIQT